MVLFISLFHDYKLPSLRVYAAVFHFVATFFLTWTRIDSLNAAIPDVTDNDAYMTQELCSLENAALVSKVRLCL